MGACKHWTLFAGYHGKLPMRVDAHSRGPLLQHLRIKANASLIDFQVGERISVAGQIGLLSTDLTLPGGSSLPKSAEHLSEEVVLSLQHARRILRVVQEARAEKGLGWVEGCLCWLDAEASRAGDGRGKSSGLLRASRAAWNAQLRVGDGSDEDYEEDEEEDESSSAWLGILPSGPSPPVLFVSVPSGALPRSAAIEWQLAAHTGRAVSLEWRDGGQDGRPPLSDDDDDEDDEGEEHGEAGLPHIVSGECGWLAQKSQVIAYTRAREH